MSALSIQPTYPIFTDIDGQPLEAGYVWIGTANLDPQTNPINVYWDAALTILAPQPIRTLAGYPSNNGTPARLYVNSDYSIRVMNKNGSVVYSAPAATERYSDAVISAVNAEDVIYDPPFLGGVQTNVEAKLAQTVSVKDFGAVGDGVTDDRNSINAAFAAVFSRGAGTVYFPAGNYRCTESIGNVSNVTNRISIAVIGEAGTVLEFDPAVAGNVGLDLRFAELNICIVKNISIDCNDKVATGLRVVGNQSSPTEPVLRVEIDGVEVSNCKMLDVVSVTTSASGIELESDLGVTCSITNCYVVNVSRDKLSSSSGIAVTGFINTLVKNNSIFNVTHNGITPLQDADGIKVFSFNDGAGRYYRQSTATIINNRIVNCDGRFVKLQTNGNAVVENNTLSLTAAMQLITNFQFIDSQIASATISHNKIQALSNWTGGGSAAVFSLQFSKSTNLLETNESFVQRIENNDVYITKRFAYGVTAEVVDASQCNVFYIIKQNTITSDIPLELTGTAVNAAVARFVYIGSGVTLAGFTGKWFLDISDNRVSSSAGLLSVAPSANDDYADKWFWYIYDNFIYTYTGSDIVVTGGGSAPSNDVSYTSTLMVRDNNIGSTGAGRNRLRLPLNVSKILGGSDFETGDGSAPAMTNVPANWNNGRIYKKGVVTGVETVSGATAYHYLSNNGGLNWYQV
jgi:hypothetical protein